MRPRDLAKIGRMVLAHGEWQGRQVVPADWVAESLRPHIAAGDGLGYGYQWWTGTVDRDGKTLARSAGFGNRGRLFVVPELDLTAGVPQEPTARRLDGPQFGHNRPPRGRIPLSKSPTRKTRADSSAGRARPLQGRGRRFEP